MSRISVTPDTAIAPVTNAERAHVAMMLPETRYETLEQEARYFVYRLRKFYGYGAQDDEELQRQFKLEELTDANWSEYYNPAFPTIAFTKNGSPTGFELLGYEAAQARAVDHPDAMNFVVVPEFAPRLDIVQHAGGGKYVRVREGLLFKADGSVGFGRFSEPIIANSYDTYQRAWHDEYDPGGLSTLGDWREYATTRRKSAIRLNEPEVTSPRADIIPGASSRKKIKRVVSSVMGPEGVVVKPDDGMRGQG